MKYLYRSRPPSIGCQPEGFTNRETWLPGRQHPSGDGRYFLGLVGYPQPLPFEEVYRYELWPVDEVERAEMTFWLEGDAAKWLLRDYLSLSVEELQQCAGTDLLAAAALVLKMAA